MPRIKLSGDTYKSNEEFISGVDTWLFDLDDTLYPRSSGLHRQMLARVILLIQRLTGESAEAALERHRKYYDAYGTSMIGLLRHHDLPPQEFLEFVHQIDLAVLQKEAPLAENLARLPGRRIIFTNGPTDHAIRVTEKLGIRELFDEIRGIETFSFVGKPDRSVYGMLLDSCDVDPSRALMFDDREVNLDVPFDIGMRTVLVSEENHAVQCKHAITRSVSEFFDEISFPL